ALLGDAVVSNRSIGDLTFEGDGEDLRMESGTIYIDGVACNPDPDQVTDDAPTEDGRYLAYVDAWERGVTAVDDPSIREVALGGPDTTTRTELVSRVRFLSDDTPTCEVQPDPWIRILQGPSGTLEVRVGTAPPPADRCLVPEEAGYTGLQNRLYRVEIHDGNFDPTQPGAKNATAPTFKWAVDNASTVGRWGAPSGREIEVDQLGPGGTEGFPSGSWVELTVEADDLDGRPGLLAEIGSKTSSTLTLVEQTDAAGTTLGARLAALHDEDEHPRARGWARGPAALGSGWIPLDDGIEIRFTPGASYRPGSYWTIPARTAILPGTVDRHVEWPVDHTGAPRAVRPHGTDHHHARLGIVERLDGEWSQLADCRRLFTPLVDQITFDSRGGDGQQAASGHWLPAALEVGVTKGRFGVAGRKVRFTASDGGLLLDRVPDVIPPPEEAGVTRPAPSMVVRTDSRGRAEAFWQLAPGPPPPLPGVRHSPLDGQTVVAELLDDGDDVIHLPLVFHALPVDPLVLVAAGGDGQIGDPGETLEIALRARVSAGRRAAPGQRVAFTIATRMRDGVALNERTGGSLHASTGAVTTVPWPGGTRTLRAVVETDVGGVAQVQWILGTDTGVPVQRVTAELLDGRGDPTDQTTLFTAHHGTAEEILWTPGSRLRNELDPARSRHTVQEALDILARLVRTGGGGAADVPGDPWVVSAILDGGDLDLTPRTVVPFEQFRDLRVRWDPSLRLTATPPDLSRLAEQHAIEIQTRGPSGPSPLDVELFGNVAGNVRADPVTGEQIRQDVTWTITPESLEELRVQIQRLGRPVVV
ncbi:MAG TPA: DUF6519 domain-containing protein, partial [Iamia sp.]|nr:DUF6519 domain-containing protein [Iamia sp.]